MIVRPLIFDGDANAFASGDCLGATAGAALSALKHCGGNFGGGKLVGVTVQNLLGAAVSGTLLLFAGNPSAVSPGVTAAVGNTAFAWGGCDRLRAQVSVLAADFITVGNVPTAFYGEVDGIFEGGEPVYGVFVLSASVTPTGTSTLRFQLGFAQ